VEVEEPLRNGLQQTNVFQMLRVNSFMAYPKDGATKDGLNEKSLQQKQALMEEC
jgi:hypothetical protein